MFSVQEQCLCKHPARTKVTETAAPVKIQAAAAAP